MTYIPDVWNLAKKMTWKRAVNAFRLAQSYRFSTRTQRNAHKGLPLALSVEPTTACNLRCPECPSGLRSFTRPTGMLPETLFRQLIDELHETLFYLTFYFQGEPYLHPQFTDLVRYAAQKNIYTATSTNGHFLNDNNAQKTIESGLDRLIISIDGTTQAVYESYRVGGKLEKVIEGTRNLLAWKQKLQSATPHVIFQFLVVQPNQHEIHEVKRLAEQLGVKEVKFKTAQIYDYQNGSALMPTLPQYSRYEPQSNGTYRIKNSLDNSCWRMWHSCVMTWDGKIVPCCFDKDAHHTLGELSQQSFGEIWQGESYQRFRQSLLQSRSEIEMCKNCSEGSPVWA